MVFVTLPSAMLPAMPAPPRIAIIGAGNFGSALAASLHRAGYEIAAIFSRRRSHSSRRARLLAKHVHASAVFDLAASSASEVQADIFWFCVPDSEIARATKTFAAAIEWKRKIALHSSGSLTSEALAALRARGASIASAHPLMTFVPKSRPEMAGVPFAIEGDRAAVRAARSIVRGLGGKAYAIGKSDKAAYHAWATFTSPLLTALLATAEHVAAHAGVRRAAARRRMIPILEQTLRNYAALGAQAGFSGPIVRGDAETIERHLQVLRALPAAREAYLGLARAALAFLPAKNRASLRRILAR
jgi:predicted short-subunit dehydrogenase-like oxidoreductase (DUF2520 family)